MGLGMMLCTRLKWIVGLLCVPLYMCMHLHFIPHACARDKVIGSVVVVVVVVSAKSQKIDI